MDIKTVDDVLKLNINCDILLTFALMFFQQGKYNDAKKCFLHLNKMPLEKNDKSTHNILIKEKYYEQTVITCERVLENYSEVIKNGIKLLNKINEKESLLNNLTISFGYIGDLTSSKKYGEMLLESKDRKVCKEYKGETIKFPTWESKFIQEKIKKKKVISFSLFGNNLRYLRGALQNVLLGKGLYPQWVMRFYVDDTVPSGFIEILKELGCEIEIQKSGQSKLEKLCWRFNVANDENVGYFLVRDCDSVVSLREVSTVEEWIASKKYFHVIRDWFTHTDLILAGMWGGISGLLPNLIDAFPRFKEEKHDKLQVYFHGHDQEFLSTKVWPIIKNECLVHDSFFTCLNAQPIRKTNEYGDNEERCIGKNMFALDRIGQASFLRAWIKQYPCLKKECS